MTESHPPQDLTGSWTHKRVQYWDAGADTLYLDTWPEYSGEVDEIAINHGCLGFATTIDHDRLER